MRYLAIDFGDKRTGLAVGDAQTRIVTPLRVIEAPIGRRDGLFAEITREVDRQRPEALVVGLPLNMDDTEGPAAKKARELGAVLGEHCRLPVYFHDERLTSEEADWQMARTGLTRGEKKSRRDALAAANILRDFLSTIGEA